MCTADQLVSYAVLLNVKDKAKVWADANIVKLVFIINDTETEAHMSKNSGAWSRPATPIIVDDLRQSEALAFLKSSYLGEQDQLAAEARTAGDGAVRRSVSPRTGQSMDDQLAGQIVDLVGGRILQLIVMKRDWLYGVPFDDSAEELKYREQEKLLQVYKNRFTLLRLSYVQGRYIGYVSAIILFHCSYIELLYISLTILTSVIFKVSRPIAAQLCYVITNEYSFKYFVAKFDNSLKFLWENF